MSAVPEMPGWVELKVGVTLRFSLRLLSDWADFESATTSGALSSLLLSGWTVPAAVY